MNKRVISWLLFCACCTNNALADFCITERDGYLPGVVRSVYEDRFDRIWICSQSGLYLWNGAMLSRFDPGSYGIYRPGLAQGYNNIYQDTEHNFWILTAGAGILKYHFDRDSLHFFTPITADSSALRTVWDIHAAEDTLWIAGNAGLLRVVHDSHILYSLPGDPVIIRDILQDPTINNRLWLGGTFGLASFDKTSGEFTLYPQPVSSSGWYPPDQTVMISYLHAGSNMLYCASWGAGLLAYDINNNSWTQYRFEEDKTEAPLDDNICQYILPLPDSTFLLTTWRHHPLLFNPADHTFLESGNNPFVSLYRTGGHSEGASLDRHENVWIGFYNMICKSEQFVSDVSSIHNNPVIAAIHAEGASAFSFKPFTLDKLTFPAHDRDIRVEVATGSLYPEIGIEYQLAGYDRVWKPLDRSVIHYANLPAKKFTFQVRVRQADGSVQITDSMALSIVPLIYEHWWFFPGLLLLLSALFYYIVWSRISYRKEKEMLVIQYNNRLLESELSALRAQMNPHFIFNGLNSIRNYILKQNVDEASRYLTTFSRLMRAILRHSESKFIPLKDELEALELYLKIEARRFKEEFTYRIDVDPGVDQEATYVPPLLIQPYVENAIWHGLMLKKGARCVMIRITQFNKSLHITIEDNGIGRAAAARVAPEYSGKKRSYGTKLTEERIHLLREMMGIDAHAECEDLVRPDNSPAGTRVTISIPEIPAEYLIENVSQ